SQSDEVAALKREVQALKAQQAAMERDLQTIKALLQQLAGGTAAQADPFVSKSITLADAQSKGNAAAKITVVEVSDYHCPYCRRQTLQTMPQLMADYVNSGKVKYVFVDYPIAQLHPDAFKSHEAANCAGEQGKYWQMHDILFTNSPAKEASQLVEEATMVGLDAGKFSACLGSGRHAPAINSSIARMRQLGVDGTPLTLIGVTPAPGAPMKIVSSVYGAKPYAEFKAAIDEALAQAR
ncbi:MAG: DsbA family protein, partial [Acidobacteriota bacterium]